MLSASNLRPGNSHVGHGRHQNTGGLSGAFTLSRTAPADSDGANPLSSKLNLTIVDCGTFVGTTAPTCGDGDDVSKYSAGTIAQMGTTGHLVTALGTYAADEQAPLPVHGPARQLRGQRLPGRYLERRVRLERRVGNPNGTRGNRACAGVRQAALAPRCCSRLAAVIVAMLVCFPRCSAGSATRSSAGSMTGTYDRGTLVLDEVVPVADLKVGDVITYLPPSGAGPDHLITHRIAWIGKDPTGGRVFRTKGDANQVADPWTFRSPARRRRACASASRTSAASVALSRRTCA